MAADLEPIPLYDGEIGSRVILTAQHGNFIEKSSVRGRRDAARHDSGGASACLSIQDESGRVDCVECPVSDLSHSGIGLTYDKPIEVGRLCQVAFQTGSHRLVRIHARVQRCRSIREERFNIGLKFTHRLTLDQLRIAKRRPGRDFTLGVRMRKLRETKAETDGQV